MLSAQCKGLAQARELENLQARLPGRELLWQIGRSRAHEPAHREHCPRLSLKREQLHKEERDEQRLA